MKWQLIDLFHKGGLLTYSLICMIISLSGLVSMCTVQKNSDFSNEARKVNYHTYKRIDEKATILKKVYW